MNKFYLIKFGESFLKGSKFNSCEFTDNEFLAVLFPSVLDARFMIDHLREHFGFPDCLTVVDLWNLNLVVL